MVLINCPECSKSVSSLAKSCPNCGYPFEQNELASENLKFGIIREEKGDFALYVNNSENNRYQCLGFYLDGSVIDVSIESTECYSIKLFAKVVEWFSKNDINVSKGTYLCKHKGLAVKPNNIFDEISFSITSSQGTVDYWGSINSIGELFIEYRSHINGHRSKTVFKYVGTVWNKQLFTQIL